MKSYKIIVKTLSGYFAILGEKCGFWTKTVLSLKTTGRFQKQE